MVADSGAAGGVAGLRPLNAPRPVVVEAGPDGAPRMLVEHGRRRPVAAVRDRWLVEEEWWREPIGRAYWAVELADGGVRTLYTDIFSGAWYAQAY